MERDLIYEAKNSIYDFDHPEFKRIKCKNYEICLATFPNVFVEDVCDMKWFKHYLCFECYSMFGNGHSKYHPREGVLEFGDSDRECPVCLDVKPCIFQPRCEHTLCIDCFIRCYYGDQSDEYKPEFPYPDIEGEYYDDVDNLEYYEDEDSLDSKWDNEYPLIKQYREDYDIWEDNKNENYENEENVRRCVLCRK